MKRRTLRMAAAALALALTGCGAADTGTAAQIEMRVQDGYIQYYNGTDWENLISTDELKGEKGDKGDKGDPGEKGETGPQGPKGDKGDPGANGTNGLNGADGKDGQDGKDGADGKNGTNGKDGRDGVDGKDGVASIPGITKELRASIYNYYNFFDSYNVCGHIQIDNVDKAVINDQLFWENDSSKLHHISFLMNEDGQVSLTAVAEPGWSFVKWDDGVTTPSRTITYTDDSGLSAYFAPTNPTLSWDNIKPDYHCSAKLTHIYSAVEPWIDITYICYDPTYSSSVQNSLGGGLLTAKSEDSVFGKYVDIEHSVTTTVRYGGLAAFPSEKIGGSIYDRCLLSLATSVDSGNESATLRIQVLQDGKPVDPETVLPPLSTVTWLEQGE